MLKYHADTSVQFENRRTRTAWVRRFYPFLPIAVSALPVSMEIYFPNSRPWDWGLVTITSTGSICYHCELYFVPRDEVGATRYDLRIEFETVKTSCETSGPKGLLSQWHDEIMWPHAHACESWQHCTSVHDSDDITRTIPNCPKTAQAPLFRSKFGP